MVKLGSRLRSVWEFGHPSKFQRVLHLGIVTAPTSLSICQLNFAQCLAVLVHYIYVFGGSCPLMQFCHVQWSSGHQPNFAAFSRGRHLYSAGRPSRWASAHILVDVCLYVRMSIRSHFSKTTYLCYPRVWLDPLLTRDDTAIRNVISVLWMTSCLPVVGHRPIAGVYRAYIQSASPWIEPRGKLWYLRLHCYALEDAQRGPSVFVLAHIDRGRC